MTATLARPATCNWCSLSANEAQDAVIEAARRGESHRLGPQCWHCQRRDWEMKSIGPLLRQIEESRDSRAAVA